MKNQAKERDTLSPITAIEVCYTCGNIGKAQQRGAGTTHTPPHNRIDFPIDFWKSNMEYRIRYFYENYYVAPTGVGKIGTCEKQNDGTWSLFYPNGNLAHCGIVTSDGLCAYILKMVDGWDSSMVRDYESTCPACKKTDCIIYNHDGTTWHCNNCHHDHTM